MEKTLINLLIKIESEIKNNDFESVITFSRKSLTDHTYCISLHPHHMLEIQYSYSKKYLYSIKLINQFNNNEEYLIVSHYENNLKEFFNKNIKEEKKYANLIKDHIDLYFLKKEKIKLEQNLNSIF